MDFVPDYVSIAIVPPICRGNWMHD